MAHILVVDDEEDLRENIQIMLGQAGHEIVTAANGQEALDIIRKAPPDLVVCDISMPVLSGLQVLSTVRHERPGLATLPFILLSALSDREDIITGREGGCDDYLTKPVDFALLKTTIDNRLSRVQKANELKEMQFVRLFKGLKKEQAATPGARPEDDRPDPLANIRTLADTSLAGRVALFTPEDYFRGFERLPDGMRRKIIQVHDEVIGRGVEAGDVLVTLGGSMKLLTLATPDRGKAVERFSLIRMKLARAFGRLALSGEEGEGTTLSHEEEDGPQLDAETRQQLKILFDTVTDRPEGDKPAPRSFADIADRFRQRWEPVWSAKQQAVNMVMMRVTRRYGELETANGPLLTLGGADPMICDMQVHLVDSAAQAIMTTRPELDGRRKGLLGIVPFSVQSLLRYETFKVERALADLKELVQPGEVGFHLTDIDGQVSVGHLRFVIKKLGAVSDFITTDLRLDDGRCRPLAEMGIAAFHLDLDPILRLGLPREGAMALMAEMVKAGTGLGRPIWCSNVALTDMGRVCEEAGARFLSGRLVGDLRNNLGSAYALPHAKVYMKV